MSILENSRPFVPARCAFVSVLDTSDSANDRSGDTFAAQIPDQLRDWCADPKINTILKTKGTELAGHGLTVEAHRYVH